MKKFEKVYGQPKFFKGKKFAKDVCLESNKWKIL